MKYKRSNRLAQIVVCSAITLLGLALVVRATKYTGIYNEPSHQQSSLLEKASQKCSNGFYSSCLDREVLKYFLDKQ